MLVLIGDSIHNALDGVLIAAAFLTDIPLGLVTTLGTTACNPLYYYYNHGPTVTPSTPTGTFNVTVTGQSTNGVTAITNSVPMVLTVQ